jgi:Mn-dependent DtxR family transcriptional regulator
MGDVSYTEEDRRRHIMATLYKSDSWGEASVEVASLARFLEADPETMKGDLLYLKGIGYVMLSGSRVALTEAGYRAMDNREFSFCPHL